jgi:hypothetical protein
MELSIITTKYYIVLRGRPEAQKACVQRNLLVFKQWHLPTNHKVLSSNPSTTKKPKTKTKPEIKKKL